MAAADESKETEEDKVRAVKYVYRVFCRSAVFVTVCGFVGSGTGSQKGQL